MEQEILAKSGIAMYRSRRSDTVMVGFRPPWGLQLCADRTVGDPEELRAEYLERRGDRRRDVWIAGSADCFQDLRTVVTEPKGNLRLLLLDPELPKVRKEFLDTLFEYVFVPDTCVTALRRGELIEVLQAPNRDDLVIGVIVDPEDDVLVLIRGNLDRLLVPGEMLCRGNGTETPDFDDVSLLDHGHTLRFGEFEASVDAILYELDPEYRRRAKRRLLQRDDSFGGALRRLRLQRALTQQDFEPEVSARTIRRIEKGEVEPRRATIQAIADRLSVAPEEIQSF